MTKRVTWPDEIELPDNWNEPVRGIAIGSGALTAMDTDSTRTMCVSMFLGRRLWVGDWDIDTAWCAVARLVGMGFTAPQAEMLVRLNDKRRGHTKAAIRKALELKGYTVPK